MIQGSHNGKIYLGNSVVAALGPLCHPEHTLMSIGSVVSQALYRIDNPAPCL